MCVNYEFLAGSLQFSLASSTLNIQMFLLFEHDFTDLGCGNGYTISVKSLSC